MSVDMAALVASPHFHLMEGMPMRGVLVPDTRAMVVAVTETHALFVDAAPPTWPERPSMDWMAIESHHGEGLFKYFEPDPDHWRFAGCMLHLVREAWGQDAKVRLYSNNSVGVAQYGLAGSDLPTFVHAFPDLCAALLAAPAKAGS